MAQDSVEKVVCVFCGSSSGKSPEYMKAAERMGQLIYENRWGLVYGGGTTGMMGCVAKAAATRGAPVEGIIPKALIEREQAGQTPDAASYGKTTVVYDMHTRKRMMGQKSDAFIALPGGYGTAEELFEVITWNQLGIHSRPIVLLNTEGFYDGLMAWINNSVDAGFVSELNKKIVVCVNTPEEAIKAVNEYVPPEGRLALDWSVQSPTKD
ncbi:hypothetical protein TRICI_002787 [Trichomonascus ciferrii]|uniref:Cytokinin riboside 5'-monophosphate phosphoribohydrolase n=1 Tax=Trichomonascus ciferrii TaxID=44093 RepID=A0A642V5U8_9ASCO|nr:hypothetical protein TRICI_002787 [Trichomonascus ciferrii]